MQSYVQKDIIRKGKAKIKHLAEFKLLKLTVLSLCVG